MISQNEFLVLLCVCVVGFCAWAVATAVYEAFIRFRRRK